MPSTITSDRDLCAFIGENIARETAATVVSIATRSILLTSSRPREDLQYQNAPSTATPIMMGRAMASRTENVKPSIERMPVSAPTTSRTPVMVAPAKSGSRNPMVRIRLRMIIDGMIIEMMSCSATCLALANNTLVPAASTLNSVAALISALHSCIVDQSTSPASLESQTTHNSSSAAGGWVAEAPANAGQARPGSVSSGSSSRVTSKAFCSSAVEPFPHHPCSIIGCITSAHWLAFSSERFLEEKA